MKERRYLKEKYVSLIFSRSMKQKNFTKMGSEKTKCTLRMFLPSGERINV